MVTTIVVLIVTNNGNDDGDQGFDKVDGLFMPMCNQAARTITIASHHPLCVPGGAWGSKQTVLTKTRVTVIITTIMITTTTPMMIIRTTTMTTTVIIIVITDNDNDSERRSSRCFDDDDDGGQSFDKVDGLFPPVCNQAGTTITIASHPSLCVSGGVWGRRR